ncbi:uncharacterized protein LOC129922930 isoform X2 [Biomphalaria glabrata]|uniref:Uncharacterized protein LOC129922930 isoform X2 n=1 Tax=Biomphalaria glabrata TaxID=6526 RepID=A0A9W2YWR4_BIOGL|nr:uncharacterized protein LOC129922930 isoform X2 [Biomphalaria glabrata]
MIVCFRKSMSIKRFFVQLCSYLFCLKLLAADVNITSKCESGEEGGNAEIYFDAEMTDKVDKTTIIFVVDESLNVTEVVSCTISQNCINTKRSIRFINVTANLTESPQGPKKWIRIFVQNISNLYAGTWGIKFTINSNVIVSGNCSFEVFRHNSTCNTSLTSLEISTINQSAFMVKRQDTVNAVIAIVLVIVMIAALVLLLRRTDCCRPLGNTVLLKCMNYKENYYKGHSLGIVPSDQSDVDKDGSTKSTRTRQTEERYYSYCNLNRCSSSPNSLSVSDNDRQRQTNKQTLISPCAINTGLQSYQFSKTPTKKANELGAITRHL